MANPLRGDVAFQAQGANYTLRLSVNAICELEEKLGRGFIDIGAEMQSWSPPLAVDADGAPVMVDGEPQAAPETPVEVAVRLGRIRFGVLRAVMWAGLREHHPAITLLEAGDIVGALGGMMPALALISASLKAALPDPAAKGEAAPPRPPVPSQPAADGTGSAS